MHVFDPKKWATEKNRYKTFTFIATLSLLNLKSNGSKSMYRVWNLCCLKYVINKKMYLVLALLGKPTLTDSVLSSSEL